MNLSVTCISIICINLLISVEIGMNVMPLQDANNMASFHFLFSGLAQHTVALWLS